MALHVVQLDEEEFKLLNNLLDATHHFRLQSERGAYKGAFNSSPEAQAIRSDLNTIVTASKAARPSND